MRSWIRNHQLATALIALLVVVIPGYFRVEQIVGDVKQERFDRTQAQCERAVAARDDARAFWLYVFTIIEQGPVLDQARAELDKRIPPLACNADHEPIAIVS